MKVSPTHPMAPTEPTEATLKKDPTERREPKEPTLRSEQALPMERTATKHPKAKRPNVERTLYAERTDKKECTFVSRIMRAYSATMECSVGMERAVWRPARRGNGARRCWQRLAKKSSL